MNMGLRKTLLVTLCAIALLGAGCIGSSDELDPNAAPSSGDDSAAGPTTTTLNFTGTLMAPNPTYPNPTPAPLPDVGQEGVHHALHKITLNATTSAVKITLTWDNVATPPAAVPDLDMFVYDPEGTEITENAGATGGPSETITLEGPLAAGEYTIRVNLFAGANVSYALSAEITEGVAAPAADEATA